MVFKHRPLAATLVVWSIFAAVFVIVSHLSR